MSASQDPTVGRDAERARLAEEIDAARAGEGRLVLLSGEAGVGKSHLADAVLASSELRVFIGRAREELSSPYAQVLSALREYLRGAPHAIERLGPLGRYLAMLLPELGPAPETAEPDVLVEALAAAWVRAAEEAPTALVLEDLHWADDATIELLPTLAERARHVPLLVLATYRSDDIPRTHPVRRLRTDLRRARALREIEVGPMRPEETAALLAHVLEDRPADDLAALVFEKTQGVPLYVEELARALRSGGRLETDDAGVRLIGGDAVPVPESISDAVILRLDGLSEAARALLEIAAVSGMEFDLELVVALAGAEEGIEELIETQLVTETAGAGSFRHALIREAILEQIAWSRRRALNRRIASYLDRAGAPPEVVAEHWLAANEQEPARRALLALADRSCRVHAYRDAARAGHRALEIWPEGSEENERLDALMRLAHCAQVTGQLGDAVRALREVVDRAQAAGAGPRRAAALRALGTVYSLQGSWGHALETRILAAKAFEAIHEPVEAAAEWLAAAGRYTGQSRLDAALEAVRRALALAEAEHHVDSIVRAKGFEGNLLAMQGDTTRGRALAQEALSLALAENATGAAAEAYRRLASVLDYASDFTGSREAYDAAVNYCRAQGDDVNACICLGCMSFILFRTGDWKRALDVCREVVNDPVTAGGTRVMALGIAGIIRALRGELRPARTALADARAAVTVAEITFAEAFTDFGYALLAEMEGNDEEAARLHERVLEGWRETQDRHDLVSCFFWQATTFGRRGREHETTERAEALGTMASGTGNPETMGALAHALGEVSLVSGDAAEAKRQFAQALELMEKTEVPLEVAVSAWRLGSACAALGERDEAARHLGHAAQTAKNLGARAVAAWIGAELDALAEAPTTATAGDATRGENAPAGHGTVTLTPRQREIVRLISDGLTNKEIAAKLFLSPRTVDMHVSRILDRLDCRTRTEAARKAAELGIG